MAREKASDICHELENRFLTYALSTIVSRSLPDVRDGLKPIHRRILYAMHSLGLTAVAKYVKSAKIIGEVLGKYHPHGDASTYESMARMAQDFSMRYPLVDGKGNFGSVDGDAPAAYRYTEGKTTSITAYLVNDLNKDTVDFRANYDNTLEEPVVFPARLPNLLVNGSSGIAVGMACSFPSHNLSETIAALVSMIDDPEPSVAKLLKHIKGPDFPTGGIILNSKAELRKAYEEGSGTVKIRGEWALEELPRGRSQIVIASIPYGINKSKLIEKIAEIIIAKKLPPLTDVRDESDENVRVVLEIKTGAEPEKVMAYLFKHSELESAFQLNFTCLKPNGEPARLSLLEICRYFLDFRKETVVRKLNYELSVILKRLHILEGFAAIFSALDKALKLIRTSKSRQEAHGKLRDEFGLDDEQTSAILEIPLYRLVSMEIGKIIDEMNEKNKEKKRIQEILKSPARVWQVVKEELLEIDKSHGDKRLTKIKTVEALEYNAEDFIEHEDVVVVLSKNGWLRKFKTVADPAALKFKENDALLGMVKANTRDCVAIFTSFGMTYVTRALNLPYTRGGFGDPVQSLFKFGDGEKVIAIFSLAPGEILAALKGIPVPPAETGTAQKTLDFGAEEELRDAEFLAASDTAYGFRFPLANLGETTRSGKKIMSLKDNQRMAGISLVAGDHVFLASSNGKGLLVPLDQIAKLTGAGMGARLMKLADEATLAGFKCVGLKDKAALAFDDGSQKEISMKDIPVYQRGSQGVIVSKRKTIVNVL
ncbi:MAG: DNA topoisomerase 4 subunit A [Nitrospinae bacterium]|nr:DNA topoisomerase 4 subunit A [Nitrospinota bacterium]